MPTIGSLFSGIGGIDLGFEYAVENLRVAWQAEKDAWCRSVLAHNFPGVRVFDDVAHVNVKTAERVDIIAGGFPCQDLSTANVQQRQGLNGERSGLWREFIRIVGELEPSVVFVENVGQSWRDWVPFVRLDLHRLGYPSVPLRLSTADLGAPHHRDRVFVVAHADCDGEPLRRLHAEVARLCTDARRAQMPWRNPYVGAVRVDDGVPRDMAAIRAFGNAASPEVVALAAEAMNNVGLFSRGG